MAFVLPTLITVLLAYRRLCRNAGRQTRSSDRLSQSYWLYLTALEWTLSCNARFKELRLSSIRNDHFHWSWAKPLDIPHIQEACFNVTGCAFFKQYICLAWTLCSPTQPFFVVTQRCSPSFTECFGGNWLFAPPLGIGRLRVANENAQCKPTQLEKILWEGALRDDRKKAEKEAISSTAFQVRSGRLDPFNDSFLILCVWMKHSPRLPNKTASYADY